jgi:hypothetical protein
LPLARWANSSHWVDMSLGHIILIPSQPVFALGNYIVSVMLSVLASSVIDCGYELRSCQTKEYKIGICCFSAKYIALRRKSKEWLARYQDNVTEWGDMSTRRLLFQWVCMIKLHHWCDFIHMRHPPTSHILRVKLINSTSITSTTSRHTFQRDCTPQRMD